MDIAFRRASASHELRLKIRCRVYSVFRVRDLGFRVWGLGFRGFGSGSPKSTWERVETARAFFLAGGGTASIFGDLGC